MRNTPVYAGPVLQAETGMWNLQPEALDEHLKLMGTSRADAYMKRLQSQRGAELEPWDLLVLIARALGCCTDNDIFGSEPGEVIPE